MADNPTSNRFAPGFDFLQDLVKNAGAALPNIGQWALPTLDAEEIGKRIEELRTVQFWLEQNVRMLGATIQALEVQRLTLSTLRTMNVQLDELREGLAIRPDPAGHAAKDTVRAESKPASEGAAQAPAQAGGASAVGVDPMQWWGALTRQFTELAATAAEGSGLGGAAKGAPAGAKSDLDATRPGRHTPAAAPTSVPRKAAAARRKSAPKG